MKIASTLTALVDAEHRRMCAKYGKEHVSDLAGRELRALLAVARAARRVELLHKRQWNGPGATAREDMTRALARLERLSRKERER